MCIRDSINTIINHHHSSPSPLTPNVINLTIQAVEQVVQKFRVKKVKTIGSTIMLVAGVDDPRSREEQVTGMVEAAVMIRSSIFQPMATTTMCTTSSSSTLSPPLLSTPSEPSQQLLIPNLSYRFGIHCGPCFGAVTVSYTHLRAHETPEHLVCRLLLEKKKPNSYSKDLSIHLDCTTTQPEEY
eukprot:TRINITY_DN26903_c0_g1_i1.p1 TRINITY_DN26903_c0_g1~~TRINITY_DN26903_c0_g1_i1.p1  ORF type:complete len:184 (-),score=29.21 TRINITY_DN26903_c0_g1_i1:16-567(-)